MCLLLAVGACERLKSVEDKNNQKSSLNTKYFSCREGVQGVSQNKNNTFTEVYRGSKSKTPAVAAVHQLLIDLIALSSKQ